MLCLKAGPTAKFTAVSASERAEDLIWPLRTADRSRKRWSLLARGLEL